jgi:hypothetical protein
MPKTKKPQDKIEVEPGAEKRLANILKKALNTPPARHGKEPQRQRSDRKSEKR